MSNLTCYPCMRCGDPFSLNVTVAYLPEVCGNCLPKVILSRYKEPPHWYRHRKGCERHPTWLALVAALNDADSPF